MTLGLWEKVVKINTILAPLREPVPKTVLSTADLVTLRSQLRGHLEDLRGIITEQYSERDAYYVLFPLTAHCDEWVRKRVQDIAELDWPPLQQELYQVDDAGDLFFELLDNTLSKPETLYLVYEVYYFCLRDGFCGRYIANPERINDYLDKLAGHIRVQPLADNSAAPSVASRRAFFRIPVYFYYCSAGVLLLLLYVFLLSLASTWHPV
ncbi:MAG: hypothetical protein CTY18_02725 [Methylomonas sp.]|nr:MAG: hypothetical protein CTY24_10405 [Methylobacter sp.]PPD36714.1 MAG: hypothetical protein CTY18_02725 [Methylomonas sp.]